MYKVITISNMNEIEVMYKQTSQLAIDEYFKARSKGLRAQVFNKDGILIVGRNWR